MGADMKLQRMGTLIKEGRSQKGMSQAELAKLLRVSVAAVSKWETGKNTPDMSNMERIAAILDIPIHEFLGIDVPESANTLECAEEEAVHTSGAEIETGEVYDSTVMDDEDALSNVEEATAEPAAGSADGSAAVRTHFFKAVFLGIVLALLSGFIAAGVIVWQFQLMKTPRVTIVEESNEDTYYGKVCRLVLEYEGELTKEFLEEQAELFRNQYSSYFKGVQALHLLYYKSYDPSSKTDKEADFDTFVFLYP